MYYIESVKQINRGEVWLWIHELSSIKKWSIYVLMIGWKYQIQSDTGKHRLSTFNIKCTIVSKQWFSSHFIKSDLRNLHIRWGWKKHAMNARETRTHLNYLNLWISSEKLNQKTFRQLWISLPDFFL